MDACPRRDEIEAWVRGDSAQPEIAAHVEACARCRERAQRARADRELLGGLRAVAHKRVAPSEVRVAGYRIEGELRRGGQGVVYRATQEATRRAVALKVLLGGSEGTARERKRFEREIELASRLRHPFVVTVFDSGEADGVPWYAMELVEGRPLDEWARERKRGVRESVELFARVCAGVAYAHRRGVIHRDLKPANVLIDGDDKPRILDFGAARDTDGPSALRVTAPGEFLGTLAYAAPEQLRGDASEIDTRTDVYALGLVLYELVTGRSPFGRASSVSEVVENSRTGVVAPPSRHARAVDRELDAIALRTLEREPGARYGSAEALERDVARYLAGEPLEARGHGAWYVLRRALVRHRGKALVAGVALAACAVFARVWIVEHARAERQHDQAALVRSVFQDMLGAADPQRMGADVRLLEVFELAARNVENALGDAPDVQAEVQLTIGDTYRRLLRASEAESHLRRALERFREVDDARELEVARCANLLGLALSAQNSPESIAVQTEALAIRERELGANDPLVAESQRGLAIALLCQFRDADEIRARTLLERALSSQRDALGDDDIEVAETKVWRTRAGSDLSDPEVEALLASASTTFEHAAVPDPRAIDCFNAYAGLLQEESRFDEARERLNLSLALARKLFGEELATDMLRRHARLEFARGDAVAAEQLSRQAIAHELERSAERRPDEAEHLRALAHRVEQPGSPTAEPPYAEAFAALRGIMGDGSFELAQWINGVALTLRAQGRVGATPPMLREALFIRCRALGTDCPVRQHTIELFADGLLAANQGADAVELLEESLSTYERNGHATSEPARRASELLERCRAQPRIQTSSAE